jgi:dynein light chain LC8-type
MNKNRPQQVEEKIDSDNISVGRLEIIHCDANSDVKEFALNVANQVFIVLDSHVAESCQAAICYYKGEKKHMMDVAMMVKEEVSGNFEGAWHVIVGKSFGSYVTHEAKT